MTDATYAQSIRVVRIATKGVADALLRVPVECMPSIVGHSHCEDAYGGVVFHHSLGCKPISEVSKQCRQLAFGSLSHA